MGLTWNVWIIVLAPSYEERITSEMVNLGLEVSPLSQDGKVSVNSSTKNGGIILAYRVCDPKGHRAYQFNEMITSILAKNKMMFFGMVISEAGTMCTWRSSNISYPETKKEFPKNPLAN